MKTRLRPLTLACLITTLVGCTNRVEPTRLPPTPLVVLPSSTISPTTKPTPSGNIAAVGSTHPPEGMRTGRPAHAAVLLQNGEVLITGGFGPGDNAYEDSAELYNAVTGEFVFTEKMAVKRCCHTATTLPDGRVLIAGGFNGDYLS